MSQDWMKKTDERGMSLVGAIVGAGVGISPDRHDVLV
jgi:hypothetical protein